MVMFVKTGQTLQEIEVLKKKRKYLSVDYRLIPISLRKKKI